MKTERKILDLIQHGFKPTTIKKLNENQINALHIRLMEQGAPQNTTKSQKTVTTYKVNPNSKTMINGLEIDTSGGQTKVTPMGEREMSEEMDFLKGKKKNEVKEKSVSKQQQKFMGLAYSVKKGDTPKSEVSKEVEKAAEGMSKKELKKFAETKHKGLPQKKETKENYMNMIGKAMNKNYSLAADKFVPGLNWKASVAENIKKMVDKHITPKISKKDFINFIIENEKRFLGFGPEVAPTKPDTKPRPTTEPKPDVDDPDFDPFINPDPKDDPEAKSPLEAPTKPDTKPRPTTEPKPDVDDPDFDPFINPDPKDDPEARGRFKLFMNQVKKFGKYKK